MTEVSKEISVIWVSLSRLQAAEAFPVLWRSLHHHFTARGKPSATQPLNHLATSSPFPLEQRRMEEHLRKQHTKDGPYTLVPQVLQAWLPCLNWAAVIQICTEMQKNVSDKSLPLVGGCWTEMQIQPKSTLVVIEVVPTPVPKFINPLHPQLHRSRTYTFAHGNTLAWGSQVQMCDRADLYRSSISPK